MAFLKVNGVTFPDPDTDGVTWGLEPVFAKGTGRSESGRMHLKLVTHKWHGEYSFSNVTADQIGLMLQTLKPTGNLSVEAYNPETKAITTLTMYVSPQQGTWKRFTTTKKLASAFTFTLIEM